MKTVRWVFVSLVVAVLCAGCASAPTISVTTGNLKSDHVVYFEQSDRIPKDVLLAAYASNTNRVATAGIMAIDPTIYAELFKKLFEIAPQIAEKYSNERMNNSLLNRRMLFVGYGGTNELDKIKEIVDKMGSSFEHATPNK